MGADAVSPDTDVLLEARALEFSYGESVCLRGANLEARRGEITCVLGRNGAGKTTLLLTLMGLLRPRRGSVLLEGRDITRNAAYRRSRMGLKLVPQGREIFPFLSVEENLTVGLEGQPRSGSGPGLDGSYALFPVLGEMRRRRGGDLSGGQQQQLAIARALIGSPKVLLLDEPTEGIQPSVIKEIGAVLQRLIQRGDMAVVLVEQYLDFVADIGHRYVVMERGRMVASGAAEGLKDAALRRRLSV